MPRMTVGMATYDDFNGVYFTVQALRLYQDMQDVELLVVDNFGCEETKRFVEGWSGGRYILRSDIQGTAAPRDLVFREAAGDIVVCCDSHVLFPKDVIARLKQFYDERPDCDDLLQGPLLYDDAKLVSTHLDPIWRDEFYGIWATDPRGADPEGEPFEIPMQGLGAFACRRSAWLGFNPAFRGFGGEEGYIHEKFRQAGRRTLCLPWFRWMHRFGRPSGVPYRLTLEDKFRNYLIGHAELGLDLAPLLTQFSPRLTDERVVAIALEVLWGAHAPSTPELREPTLSAPQTVGSNGAAPHPTLDHRVSVAAGDVAERRAIVCFVDDKPHLVQQALALRHSWLHASSPDTDLVVMGPPKALARFPDDVVKIPQRAADEDAAWRGYPYANSIVCMNGDGAELLDRYTHLLRTDVDTFITPAWNDFHPTSFTCGIGAYSNDDDVRQRIREIAARYGLVHHGITNVGSTWYGRTDVVRRASAFTEMLVKHILSHYFASDEGAWPGWYRGVTLLYAGEIAVNHCAPDAKQTALLDAVSTTRESVSRCAHIHCWHTDDKFSKHHFMSGRYTAEDAQDLDLGVVSDYCMAMSFRSLGDLAPSIAPLVRPFRIPNSHSLMSYTYGAALLASALATSAALAQDTRSLTQYIDSISTAAITDQRTAGVSVAVVKNGRTILAKGYGFADLENDVPATPQTVYRIGSVTKQFTSAAIMRLMEQGKLSLDDTLQKFMPNVPAQGNRVTIRHLLNHTSGIKSYTSLGPKWGRGIRLDLATDSLLALFANEPFDFKPGDAFRYNNSGYFLLGMLIEKLSGKTYAQYLQDEFFTPLGLKGTLYCDQAPLIKHRAQGYAPKPGGGYINAEPLSMTQPYAAGALCSTVTDLAVWAQALASGKVVSPASYKLMTTPVALNDGKPMAYGFGLGTGTLAGHRQVSHNGGINGFISELHHYPDDSVITVVLTNTGAPTAVQLERLIARRALGIKDLPAVAIDASALGRLVGQYALGSTPVRVFVENGRLRVQQQGNPAFGLKHVGGERFVRDDNDDVRFEFAAGTPAPSVVRHQGGTVATATRVP